MMLWLHETCGYNYFNIPKLTYPEIEDLIEAKNRQIKKKNQESKKMEAKAKMKGRYRR